jgi:hypothetical protein
MFNIEASNTCSNVLTKTIKKSIDTHQKYACSTFVIYFCHFPPQRPRFTSEQHVGFVVDKAALGQVFSEYFGFPCQSSFHQFLHHHNQPGLAQ